MIFKPCTGLNGFDMYDGPSSQLCKRRSRSRLVEAPDTGVCLLPKSGKNLPNSLEACYLFSRSDHFNLYYIIIAKLATWSSLCHKVAFSPCASNWRGIGVCLPPMLSIARCSLHEPPRGTSLFYFILFYSQTFWQQYFVQYSLYLTGYFVTQSAPSRRAPRALFPVLARAAASLLSRIRL